MKELIDTMRLSLRPFTHADVEEAFGWFGDPEVMRFTPTGPDRNQDQPRERLKQYRGHQVRRGFSKWLIQEKSSGKAIGDSGLLILEELSPLPDLGFRFAKPYWQRGFATEVAAAWIRVAFDEFGLDRLTAFAHVDNPASLRVLEKVGFRVQKREPVMGMDSFTGHGFVHLCARPAGTRDCPWRRARLTSRWSRRRYARERRRLSANVSRTRLRTR